jgi:NAD(P)-dependent dehydrogenase (short-subunit alcohol dehydrogenase family)
MPEITPEETLRMSFADKVVIVTGAAGNLGSAVLRRLEGHGARLLGVDRDAGLLDPGRLGLKDPARFAPFVTKDLADPAAAAAMAAEAVARFGRLDGLAHTVGGFEWALLDGQDAAMWERMLRMNVMTTASALAAVLGPMRAAKRGSVVAVGAGAAIRAPSGMAAYAGAKAAVHRLVESAAEELKTEGVRVNAVLPSIIDTPQNRAAMPDADPSRWVTPAEVSEAIAFLLSDAASGVTGALLPVSGRV